MAQTFTKRAVQPVMPDDAYLNFVAQYAPEAATQTFVAGSMLIMSGGGLTVAADPGVGLWGLALEDAHNDLSLGTHNLKYFPFFPGACIYVNLLTGAAADATLAAANLGTAFDIAYSATMVGGSKPGWHLDQAVSSSAAAFKVISFFGDETIAASPYGNEAKPGDINARLAAMICLVADGGKAEAAIINQPA